jgi:hypothetical protein
MGNFNCSNCKNNEDLFSEIKSDLSSKNDKIVKMNSSDFSNIKNKQKNLENSHMEYSLALFQRYNLIRTEPIKFYSESEKYNLTHIIEELMDKKDKSLKLTWSTKKEKIISTIMNDDRVPDIRKKLNLIKKYFSKEFDIKVYYAKGNFARIDDALWNVLYGLKNLGEDKLRNFLAEKIEYCVIYSMNEDDMKFDNESENKDGERETKDNQSNSNGAIISFFILFNHIYNLA